MPTPQSQNGAQDRQSAAIAVQLSRSTARAASKSARSSPQLGDCIDDICVIRSMHTDRPEPRAIAVHDELRRHASRAARPWAPGSPTGWARRTRTCPASSCSAPGFPVIGPQLWTSRFPARRSIRARTCPITKTDPEKLIQHIRNKELSLRRAAAPARSAGEAEPSAHGAARAPTRSSKPASSPWRSPSACRPKRRTLRHPQGERSDRAALWRRRFRPRLSDGAAPGRARRPHGAGLLRQRPALGQSRRHPDPPQAGAPRPTAPSPRCSRT